MKHCNKSPPKKLNDLTKKIINFKIYFMKKISFLVVATAIFATFIFIAFSSCQKDKDYVENRSQSNNNVRTMSDQQTIEAIKNDTITHLLVKEWLDNSLKAENPSLIQTIISDDQISENEKQPLAEAMGFHNFNDYCSHVTSIGQKIAYLNETYELDKLTENDRVAVFESVIGIYMLDELIDNNMVTNISTQQASSCANSYAICAGSVTAAAISGHVACAGADLFPPVGVFVSRFSDSIAANWI